ncbi:hypothetical protein Ancab_039283 [Ancistrocladus abbreviatus]
MDATRKVGDSELGQATATEVLTLKEMGPVKRLELAKVKPRHCQVCKTKSKRQKKSLKTKSPGSGKKSSDSNMPRAGGEGVEISEVSIWDSNIKNMNRVFLAKANCVMTEEI